MPVRDKASFHVITANSLLTGDAVFYSADDSWQLGLQNPMLFADDEKATQAVAEISATQAHLVVGAYLIALDQTLSPLQMRERLRLSGPTNYRHGKQEAGANHVSL